MFQKSIRKSVSVHKIYLQAPKISEPNSKMAQRDKKREI